MARTVGPVSGAGNHRVVGVAARPESFDRGISPRPPDPGRARTFEDEHGTAFADHEAVSRAVERSRGRLRVVVPSREGAEVAEAAHRHRRHGHLAGPGDTDIGPTQFQPSLGQRQGMVAARAGGREGGRRPRSGRVRRGRGRGWAPDSRLEATLPEAHPLPTRSAIRRPGRGPGRPGPALGGPTSPSRARRRRSTRGPPAPAVVDARIPRPTSRPGKGFGRSGRRSDWADRQPETRSPPGLRIALPEGSRRSSRTNDRAATTRPRR